MEQRRKKRADVSLIIWNPFDDDEVLPTESGVKEVKEDEEQKVHGYNPFVGTPPEALTTLLVPRMRHSILASISAAFFKGIQEELDSLEASLLSPREKDVEPANSGPESSSRNSPPSSPSATLSNVRSVNPVVSECLNWLCFTFFCPHYLLHC